MLQKGIITEIPVEKIFPTNKCPKEGVDDMVDLEHLNEPELLHNLERRFRQDKIFTFVGPTLTIINPYKMISSLFNDQITSSYQRQLSNLQLEVKAEPHIFSTSVFAFRQLVETGKNQAIVISGESGAGKTENTKFAMKILASADDQLSPSQRNRQTSLMRKSKVIILNDKELEKLQMFARPKHSLKQSDFLQTMPSSFMKKIPVASQRSSLDEYTFIQEGIDRKILGCNPILEAFGNAKTLRNDNSSRFGKLVLLLVQKQINRVKGAFITNFLLEKSRIVTQNKGERNYHIFQMIFAGLTQDQLKEYRLTKLHEYNYVKEGSESKLNNINDSELFKELMNAFNVTRFQEKEIETIFRIIAAILNLGNLEYIDDEQNPNNPCKIVNDKYLKNFCELLDFQNEPIIESLLFRFRKISGQVIKSKMHQSECKVIRDSFAKMLYENLFNWLVKRLNVSIGTLENKALTFEDIFKNKERFSIGLLDIFGFELFEFNSFEQFCINYANEKLHQLYIQYVFKGEYITFQQEGLQDYLHELNFKDNQDIIDLVDSYPMGILNLLDESSSISSSDEALLSMIIKNHGNKANLLNIPKLKRDSFIITHTAKQVEYCIKGFRIKNKDEVPLNISNLCLDSQNQKFINIMFSQVHEEEISSSPKRRDSKIKQKFLSTSFRHQMKLLMEELNSCDAHFARCIKPNEEKKAGVFDSAMVLNQIRYLGVLESIRIRKECFPIRKSYYTFASRYFELHQLSKKSFFTEVVYNTNEYDKVVAITKEIIKSEFPKMNSSQILFGKTRVFMRIGAQNEIEKKLEEKIRIKNQKALIIQRTYHMFVQRRIFKNAIKAIKTIQSLFKCRYEYKKRIRIIKAAKKIQQAFRKFLYRKKAKQFLRKMGLLRKAVLYIQKQFRMKKDRKNYLQYKKTKPKIRAFVKRFKTKYQRSKEGIVRKIVYESLAKAWALIMKKIFTKAVLVIQRFARGYICRKKNKSKIRLIKMAAFIYQLDKK